jgi:hypothetical protein
VRDHRNPGAPQLNCRDSRPIESPRPYITQLLPLPYPSSREPSTPSSSWGKQGAAAGELRLAVVHTSSVGLGVSFGCGVGARGRAPWDWTPVARESLAGLATPPLGHLLPWSDTFMRVIEVMFSPLCSPVFPEHVVSLD